MAIFETWLKSDIKNMVSVTKLTGNMFSADNNGNLIGVEVMNNGEPAELDGVVTGYVIRPDGGTLIISGTLEENRASIILPASAYVYVGQMSIVIKVGGTTVGACTGYVYRSTTDKIVDPGHVIPSIDELLQKIADCEAATVNANTAATSANNAASLANEKAALANTKAELADEKATLANEKAGLADDAATLANTKALLADEKATLANNKASLADEKAGLANDAAELAGANATLAGEKANLANAAATTANTAASKITNMTVSAYGLSPDQSPTVEITEVSGHKHITFGLVKGARGDNGKDFHIRRTFSSIAEMEAYDPDDDHTIYKVEEYDHVMIDTGSVQDPDTGKLYCYEPSTVEVWRYIGDLSGSQGIKGDPGNGISNIVLNQNYTLTITMDDGTTYTTPSVRGSQGETGATGETGETGDTGNGIDHVVLNADYTLTVYFTDNTSYTTAPIRGEQGAPGNPGANAYVYIRYAAQQPTQDSDMKTVPDEWIGIYSGTSNTAPTTYTSYTWYKFKGETGTAENIYGSTTPMSPQDSTKVSEAIGAKYTKPANGIPATDIADGVIPGVMTGSTAQAAGTAGLVPAPVAGSQNKALFGDGTWKEVADPSDMTGASAQQAGAHGLVPAPAAGDQDKALFGDGTWKTVSVEDPDDFTGATASTAGVHGLVPAPSAGDQNKVLTGDGTWKVSPGAKVYEKTVTVTNTSGAYSQTFTDENISADMKAVELEVNRSFVFGDSIIVTPNDGSVTVACNDVAGTDTIKISLIKVIDDPTAVTSTEFTVLNNRIGDLSNLETTDKTSMVNAVNEVVGDVSDNAQAIATLNSNKMNIPTNSGSQGQLLQNDGNGGAEWTSVGTPSDEQVGTAVSTWLVAHPEATTTIQDGAITRAKLDADLKEKTDTVSDLKSAIIQSNSGREIINATFVNGSVNGTTGVVDTSVLYRICSNDILQYDYDQMFSVETGFRYILMYYKSDGTFASETSGWKTGDFTINKNQKFRITIARTTEVGSETADIDTFKSHVLVLTKAQAEIDAANQKTDTVDDKLDEFISGQVEIGFTFINGSVSSSTGETDTGTKHRISTENPVSFKFNQKIEVKTGFRFILMYFDDSGTFEHDTSGWVTTSINIAKGKKFKIIIARTTENADEIADIDYFRSQVLVNSDVEMRLSPLITEYTIKADGSGDYATLRACLEAITDSSESNQYIVNIYPGEYDIASLYTSSEISDGYGLFIPDYVTLRGIGDNHNIVLKATLETQSNKWCPINISNVASMENLTVTSTNCRYTVHDDWQTRGTYTNIRRIKDCIFTGIRTYYGAVYGSGVKGGADWIFENCVFNGGQADASGISGACVLLHNNVNIDRENHVKFINCRFNTTKTNNKYRRGIILGSMTNGASNGTVTITLEGCKVNGISMYENNASEYGTGINMYVNGFYNDDADVMFTVTDGHDYSDHVDLI